MYLRSDMGTVKRERANILHFRANIEPILS